MPRKAKPSPSKYAPIVPKLRSMKARLLTLDRIREAIAQPTIDEAISLLKDTIYGEALVAGDLSRLQKSLIKYYFNFIDKISKNAPGEASPLIEAFKREIEAGDLVILASASSQTTGIPETLTGDIEGTTINLILRESEALTSITRLIESLQGTWASKYVNVLKTVAETGDPSKVTWARLLIVASEYSNALESLELRISRRAAARVLCPLLNWMLAAALIQAKRAGVEAKVLEEVLVDVPSCGFRVGRARLVYERETGVEGVVASISDAVRGVMVDASKDIVDALEEARINARKEAVRRANAVYSGYPFHAGIIAAGIILLKINIEDLLTVLHGIALKLPSEEYLLLTALS